MLDLRFHRSSTAAEFIARMAHLCIALTVLGFSIWAFSYIEPMYRLLYVALLLLGLVPLYIGLCGQRKTVFKMLLLGYWH